MKKIIIALILLLIPQIHLDSKILNKKTNVTIKNGKEINFFCEVADSPNDWKIGLMFRKKMKTNEGMLFIFPEEQYLSFWMKNTYLKLAIIFIDSDKKVIDVFYPEPLSTNSIVPSKPSKYVLEILSNVAKEIKVKRGDKVLF